MADLPIPKERKLHFSSQVDQDTIGKLSASIVEINTNDAHLKKLYGVYGLTYVPSPIEIYIDSYGGYVYQVFGLLSLIEASTVPVHTYVTGAAMSCGFLMLISGHKRFAYGYSTMLYHQVCSGTHGKTKDMVEDVQQTKKVQKMMERIVLSKTKIDKATLKSVYNTKFDWFITPKEALSLGIIDEIV